jgi:hypothetical protein
MPKILRPIRILVPTLLAAFAAAGCESSTLSPDEVRGTFVLETYNGNALPTPIYDGGVETHVLLADTMRLGRGGDGTQVRVVRVDFDDPTRPDRNDVYSSTFQYQIRGGRLEITVQCPPNALALCAPGPHNVGTHEGDALVLSFGETALRYRRVDD